MAVAKERTERDVAYGPGGLKAEAGLRGPYGTSVRHIWPTWTLLVPAVTLISTSLSLFLFLSLCTSIFLRKLSFLDFTKYRSSVMHSVLFSSQRYLVFWFILSLSTSVVTCPVENPRFSFFFILRTYTTCHHKSILGHDEHQRDGASVCTPGKRAPLLAGTRKCLPILLPTVARSR